MSAPIIIGAVVVGAALLARGRGSQGVVSPLDTPTSERVTGESGAESPPPSTLGSDANAAKRATLQTAPAPTKATIATAPTSGSKLATSGSAPASSVVGGSATVGAATVGGTVRAQATPTTIAPEDVPAWTAGWSGFQKTLSAVAGATVSGGLTPQAQARKLEEAAQAGWGGLVW